MELKSNAIYRFAVALKRSWQISVILFHGQGLFKSMLGGKPVDRDGEPIPWFTYPAIEYLRKFDFSTKRVFEYGCGNSSLFWARHAKEVIAVESDERWYRYVSSARPKNMVLLLESARDGYVTSIRRQNGRFDIIVIDGKWRNACTTTSIDYLNEGGMIIFDNSDCYAGACSRIRKLGFFQIDFNGFGPINGYAWTTSIFVKGPTEIQETYSDSSPLGGLGQVASDED
jgi:hypothetical protein